MILYEHVLFTKRAITILPPRQLWFFVEMVEMRRVGVSLDLRMV